MHADISKQNLTALAKVFECFSVAKWENAALYTKESSATTQCSCHSKRQTADAPGTRRSLAPQALVVEQQQQQQVPASKAAPAPRTRQS